MIQKVTDIGIIIQIQWKSHHYEKCSIFVVLVLRVYFLSASTSHCYYVACLVMCFGICVLRDVILHVRFDGHDACPFWPICLVAQ